MRRELERADERDLVGRGFHDGLECAQRSDVRDAVGQRGQRRGEGTVERRGATATNEVRVAVADAPAHRLIDFAGERTTTASEPDYRYPCPMAQSAVRGGPGVRCYHAQSVRKKGSHEDHLRARARQNQAPLRRISIRSG